MPDVSRLALRSRRLLDVRAGKYVDNAVVVISGDRIESIGTEVPAGTPVLDLGDRVLLPGLIDAHTHVLLQGNTLHEDYRYQILREYPAHRVARAVRSLRIALEHGFTWIRDLGTEGSGYDDVGLRDAVADGIIAGPRVLTAGPALTTTGTYPITGFRPDWEFPVGVGVCDGVEDCRRAVRHQISYGVDWIKVYANAGAGQRMTNDGYIDSAPNWTPEELSAVVDEAHSRGRRVAAHATSETGVAIAIAARVDSIEHGYSIRPEAAAAMAAQRIFLCPTVTPARYVAEARARERGPIWQKAPEVQARSFVNCLNAGVRVVFGTDVGGFPWTEINQAREFTYLVELGMSPINAIRSATTLAAMQLGLDGAGEIAPGNDADVIGVSGDPLADVATLEAVDFVMKAGQVIRPPAVH